MTIRSGRFRLTIPNNHTGEVIIAGRTGAFYRFYNSGRTNITLKPGSGGPANLTLLPRYSVDIAVGDDVAVTGTQDEEIEGIYEFLENLSEVRSGRFNFLANTGPVQIINLQGGLGGDTAWYRIFNSGEHDIKVHRKLDPAAANSHLKDLKPDQSFDFTLGASTKDIYVSGTGTNPVEGIYDYLGRS